MPKKPKATLQETLDELVFAGLIEHNGKYRNGRPVYAMTEFGRRFHEQYSTDESLSAAIDELLKHQRMGGH